MEEKKKIRRRRRIRGRGKKKGGEWARTWRFVLPFVQAF